MKIVILNTSERTGGAAIAAHRLMKAISKSGHEVHMLVRDRQTDDPRVVSINTGFFTRKINRLRFIWERLVIFAHNRWSKKNLFAVSIANTGTNISRHPLVKEADIIHLHWINQGFLSLKNIRKLLQLGKPVVWTMHDMWNFTGVCHYAGNCHEYETACRQCPLLKSGIINKTRQIFRTKQRLFAASGIRFVGCSRWMAACAGNSYILQQAQLTAIPNPIDTRLYAPADKLAVRRKFNLPADKKILLFAAAKLSDTRKGMAYFIAACHLLQQQGVDIDIVLFGGKPDDLLVHKIPFTIHNSGYLQTPEDIAATYAACDVFVIPSLEDNLPNTIMEAMACGTPCVGFNAGGIPEMIDHKINGYVADYKSAESLAAGIRWVLSDADYPALSGKAVEKVRSYYAEWIVAGEYTELYESILTS